jgi:hypothetical protein
MTSQLGGMVFEERRFALAMATDDGEQQPERRSVPFRTGLPESE